ncbi:MAG TPA: histidine kinase, partial [Rubricoccaceae bacterium]
FLQGDDRDQTGLDELRPALDAHRAASVILQNYRKDGTPFCNELHVAPVEAEDGRLLNYVGIIIDVTDRVAAENRQRESAEALRALTQRLVDVQEQERRALALELHDEIGQVLTALKFTLEHIDRAPTMPDGLLTGAREMVRGLQDQVRNLSLDLRPSMLDDFGLVPALVWLFERTERHMGLTVRFTAPERPPVLAPEVATAAFRIVQEALTNVARHAGVTESDVTLGLDEDHLMLELTIADEGTGFDPSLVHATTGLSGMAERTALLGGRFILEAQPSGGTVIRAHLPLTPQPASP